jgi:hypothetical protein
VDENFYRIFCKENEVGASCISGNSCAAAGSARVAQSNSRLGQLRVFMVEVLSIMKFFQATYRLSSSTKLLEECCVSSRHLNGGIEENSIMLKR